MANILILEDDVDFGPLLKATMQHNGFRASLHTTASEALDYIEDNKVDLIVADILIKINGEYVSDGGIKLISQLKQIQKHEAPIIAISGAFDRKYGAREARSTASSVGAEKVLAKPFSPDELVWIIKDLLRIH